MYSDFCTPEQTKGQPSLPGPIALSVDNDLDAISLSRIRSDSSLLFREGLPAHFWEPFLEGALEADPEVGGSEYISPVLNTPSNTRSYALPFFCYFGDLPTSLPRALAPAVGLDL